MNGWQMPQKPLPGEKPPPVRQQYQYSRYIQYLNDPEPRYIAVTTVTIQWDEQHKHWFLYDQKSKMYHINGYPV